jgi:hypothetical protein
VCKFKLSVSFLFGKDEATEVFELETLRRLDVWKIRETPNFEGIFSIVSERFLHWTHVRAEGVKVPFFLSQFDVRFDVVLGKGFGEGAVIVQNGELLAVGRQIHNSSKENLVLLGNSNMTVDDGVLGDGGHGANNLMERGLIELMLIVYDSFHNERKLWAFLRQKQARNGVEYWSNNHGNEFLLFGLDGVDVNADPGGFHNSTKRWSFQSHCHRSNH